MALSPEREKLLASLVEADVSIASLHKQHGFNYKTVRKYYPGYRDRNAYRKAIGLTEEDRATIEMLIEERAPVSAIEEITGRDAETIQAAYPEATWTRSEVASFGGSIGQAREKGIFI